jgi:ATP phosphoribosyltransferase regulatory subunit
MPKKFYYLGDVLALNQEHRGNANQVTQAGVELVGYSSIKAEIECMLIISRVNRELLGGRLYLELSDARFAESIAEALGLTSL